MDVTRRDVSVDSCDGCHRLAGVIYAPVGEACGFLQVVHGMTEHMGRYEVFMREMAQAGWICFGYDHLGHGKTVNDDGELGYIAKRDGWDLLARDVKGFSDAVLAEYGGKNGLPYCLMGHSMGSFIVRLAAERYVRPDRLIVMGTGGANPAAGVGLALIGLIKALRGEKHVSPLVNELAFGSYNKRFGGGSAEDPKPWLTRDAEVRRRYYADRYCSFSFTVSAMGDLIRLMKRSNRAAWFRGIPEEMPVLLISGMEDPVGDYGKGVKQVYERLKQAGRTVACVLYADARHEILNDVTYEAVKEEILSFCQGARREGLDIRR